MSLEAAAHALTETMQPVTIKPRGHSMEPRIKDGQSVTLLPALPQLVVRKGDIVLAKVNGRLYLHLVTATDRNRVQISNNNGKVNGWTPRTHVYGIAS